MRKIMNYLLTIALITIGFFAIDFFAVKAEDQEPIVKEEKIVVNPKSDGNAMYVYDVETKDEEGFILDVKKIQFIKSRDVSVLIKYTAEDLKEYDETFKICEIIKTNTGTNEQCANYSKTENKVYFQISSADDGEKEIVVRFFKSLVKSIEETKKVVLDTTGPVISLTEGEYMYIPLGEKYSEKGATCDDDSLYKKGECVVEVEKANIDMTKDTYQYVRYKTTDFLGNETNAVRKILVEVEAEESTNNLYWIGAGFGIAVLSALLFLQVWKNKEKQKNQSVL